MQSVQGCATISATPSQDSVESLIAGSRTTPIDGRRRAGRRAARLARLGFASYRDYLQSPVWAAVKARYRASNRPQVCLYCGGDAQIRHLTYERVGGDELMTDLVALCSTCHGLVRVLERRRLARLVSFADAERSRAFLEANRLADEEQAWSEFRARPLRRRIAAIYAVESVDFADNRRRERLTFARYQLVIDERVSRAIRAAAVGAPIDHHLAVIERQIERMIRDLQLVINGSSGGLIADLLRSA